MINKVYGISLLILAFLSCAERNNKLREPNIKTEEPDIKMQNQQYDLRGKVKEINITFYWNKDTLDESNKSKSVSLFDKTGTLTEQYFYSFDGTPRAHEIYTYDRSKNTGDAKKFVEGKLSEVTAIKYDNKGYLQEYTTTKIETSKKNKTTFKNNSVGQPVEITYDGDKQVLEYDNKGDVIKSTSFVSGITTYKNEMYDKAGNWTKQSVFFKGGYWVEKRQLQYYE